MQQKFWHQRWQTGAIGFHNRATHPLLKRFWPGLAGPITRVFVPLCGKSVDMNWLAAQGHGVVGCELSPLAIADFFKSAGAKPEIVRGGPATLYDYPPWELWEGDFFNLSQAELGDFAAIYDRAALIALPRAMRNQYVEHLANLAQPGTQLLLITIEHELGPEQGPPFNVTRKEVEQLFAQWSHLRELGCCAAELKGSPVMERCYHITR